MQLLYLLEIKTPSIIRNKDEDKISGYSTVEQATTVSFTEMEEG